MPLSLEGLVPEDESVRLLSHVLEEFWPLVPFLQTMEEKLGFRYPSVTTDSGYESEEGYEFQRFLLRGKTRVKSRPQNDVY